MKETLGHSGDFSASGDSLTRLATGTDSYRCRAPREEVRHLAASDRAESSVLGKTVWLRRIHSRARRHDSPAGVAAFRGPYLRLHLNNEHQRATIVAMSTEPLRQVRDHFSDIVDRVEHEHERVTVTRNGRPAAVLISPDDLAQLEETLDVLGDPDALADIREADAAYARGDVVRGVAAVRALRP